MIFGILFLRFLNEWSDFYSESEEEVNVHVIIAKGENAHPEVFTSGSIYVKSSIFENVTEAENGGGILYNGTDSTDKILIEETQFNFCHARLSGGAVYSNNCNLVMNGVCGFDCNTLGVGAYIDGPFANTFAATKESLNWVFNSQISHCTNERWGYVMDFHYGDMQYEYSNVSQNYCAICSSFYMLANSDKESLIRYTSLRNNTATTKMCFRLVSSKSMLTSSNIIENKQKSSELGLFVVAGNLLTIKDSCVIDNDSKGYYFCIDGRGSFELINCTIDFVEENSSITTSQISPDSSFINVLKLLNTGNCYGTYDVVDDIPIFIPTPEMVQERTINKKFKPIQRKERKFYIIYLYSLSYKNK